MRLLHFDRNGDLSLVERFGKNIPRYAILSHTWGADGDEISYSDIVNGNGMYKAGYNKVRFCGEQAAKDNISYFWVDTCCINKDSSAELSEAINSMFRWYTDAVCCYVYLSDVNIGPGIDNDIPQSLAASRWFTRGWTLQELIAPRVVKFFSTTGHLLGDKHDLEQPLHRITGIPVSALQKAPLSQFSVDERMQWIGERQTTREEDAAYCMLGIFDVHMPLIYGEGQNKAFQRLQREMNYARAQTPTDPDIKSIGQSQQLSFTPAASTHPRLQTRPLKSVPWLAQELRIQQERIKDKLATIPADCQLLPSVVHTAAHNVWVKKGGVLWCNTQGTSQEGTCSSIAASIAQYWARVYDASSCITYLDFPSYAIDRPVSKDESIQAKILTSLILQICVADMGGDLWTVLERFLETHGTPLDHIIVRSERAQFAPLSTVSSLFDRLVRISTVPLIIAIDSEQMDADWLIQTFAVMLAPYKDEAMTKTHRVIVGSSKDVKIVESSQNRTVSINTEYQECLASIDFAGQHVRRDQISKAIQGSNSWIWAHQKYVAWMKDCSSLLWIEGKAGSGKSVLAKEIQSRLESDQASATCDWFFSTRGGHTLTAHTVFLRSILYQLLRRDQSLFSHFTELYRKHPPESTTSWNSLEAMENIFRNVVRTGLNIHCVVDAIDEAITADHQRHEKTTLMSFLESLFVDIPTSRLKVIVFSRPFLSVAHELPRQAQPHCSFYKIVLQHENSVAIQKIVDSGINSLRVAMRSWSETGSALQASHPHQHDRSSMTVHRKRSRLGRIDHIPQRQQDRENRMLEKLGAFLSTHAKGVVLWVSLILSILESTVRRGMYTIPELEKQFEGLPLELSGIYEHCVEDIGRRFDEVDIAKIRRTLMLVSGGNAFRPMKLEELWDALATPHDWESALHSEDDPIEIGRPNIASWKEFRWQLYEMCGPLVEVVSAEVESAQPIEEENGVVATDAIQLSHRTVKDFLANPSSAGSLCFADGEATQLVEETLERYSKVVLPLTTTRYARMCWPVTGLWSDNVKLVVEYLGDKRLLSRIFATPSRSDARVCWQAVFIQLIGMCNIPSDTLWTRLGPVPKVDDWNLRDESIEPTNYVLSAHFMEYACDNALIPAIEVFREIMKHVSSHDPTPQMSWHGFWGSRDGALMVAIKYEVLDLIQRLISLHPLEPQCRFWVEYEYDVMGVSCYLTPFEMLAAHTGNETVLRLVYDRNSRFSKMPAWDRWKLLLRGRKAWCRTSADWHLLLDYARQFQGTPTLLNGSSLQGVREAIELVLYMDR